jgi:hypothetical protein
MSTTQGNWVSISFKLGVLEVEWNLPSKPSAVFPRFGWLTYHFDR